jgi:type III secretion protein U
MSDDKTEEPSEQKLRQAREKGEIPKSQDLATACSMLGVVMTLSAMGPGIFDRMRALMGHAMDFGDGDVPLIELYKRIGAMAVEGLFIVAPLAIVAGLFAAIGFLAHIGVVITFEPVMPKPEKIDPVAGMKKIFSMKSLMTLGQTLLKAIVLGVVLWKVIVALIPMLTGSVYQSVEAIGTISWAVVGKLLNIAVLLFIVLGPLDFAIQRWQFMKGQRSSKDEVKREYKQSEGDPLVKGQRKQLAHEMANEAPRKAVAGANAVIVNPTHYAVAVRYQPNESPLPIVVAKGMDAEALRIRQYAEQFGVPIFGNPPVARALHKVELNQPIPEDLFETVAAILLWVEEIGARGADVDAD